MKTIRPAIKCHGGKYYLAKWILDNFPKEIEKMTYIEPYCGGANVFFNKPKSKIEVINDIDTGLIQIYRALRDEPSEFTRRLKICKYTEETFERALKKEETEDYLECAVNEFILRRMSRGGLRKAFAWSDRQRGGKPGDINAWETSIKNLSSLSEKLQEVFIFNKPALEIIKSFNSPKTLLYIDPPYLHETRVSKNAYSFEMSEDDHIDLANVLKKFSGKVIISGYSSPLYNRLYRGWKVCKQKVPNHSSQQKTKEVKTEIIWKNFDK
jgi:DNA adenine methylase